jgi:hypothetical protein
VVKIKIKQAALAESFWAKAQSKYYHLYHELKLVATLFEIASPDLSAGQAS